VRRGTATSASLGGVVSASLLGLLRAWRPFRGGQTAPCCRWVEGDDGRWQAVRPVLSEEIRHPQTSKAVPLASAFPSHMRSLSSPAGFLLRFFFADFCMTSGVLSVRFPNLSPTFCFLRARGTLNINSPASSMKFSPVLWLVDQHLRPRSSY
jgi:hypothetical protein